MSTRSTFDVVGPDGLRTTIAPRSGEETIADLVAAMGGGVDEVMLVDGRPAAPEHRLVDVPGLRAGSQIDLGDDGGPSPAAEPVVELAVIAGPSCRAWTELAAGRHAVGRSIHCPIRLDDPLAELHHGVLDVAAGGRVRFTQLTGRVPARIDGAPCTAHGELPPGAALEVGSSLIVVRPAGRAEPAEERGSVVAGPDPWRRVVRRGPAHDPDWECPTLTVPEAPAAHPAPPVTALIGAGVAAAGAVVVASVLGHMVFALIASIGAVAALATWVVGVAGAARARRRGRRRLHEEAERFRGEVERAMASRLDHHRRRHLAVGEALEEVEQHGGRIWERRPVDGCVRATVGLADYRWLPALADRATLPAGTVADLERRAVVGGQPVPVALAAGDGLAVHGGLEAARALVRSVIVQLATWVGPADWQLLVVSREPRRWVWAGWLPPAVRADGSAGVVPPDRVDDAGVALADDRITVVVTDEPSLFDSRTGPLRRLVAAANAIVLVAVDREHTVPSICGRVLRVGSTGRAEWAEPRGDEFAGAIHVAGLDENVARRAARTLAALTDPEDTRGEAATIPVDLRFADIDEPPPPPPGDPLHDPWAIGGDTGSGDPAERVVRRWRAAGPDPAPCAPVGLSADGVVDVDLVRDGPHGLIAGTTGSGKSELLRTLVVGLATRCSPDHLTFVLVDYKGGSTFDACSRLPHTVGLVTDLDEGGAARALRSLEAELRRREHLLRAVGAADLTDYRRRAGVAPLPRLAVVVDEFAALAREVPDFLPSLVGIAQRGRSLGVHLLLATQRPAGVVSDEIRANTNLRLALRLNDVADARDVVGDDRPATLARGLAGRAVLRLGPDELVMFQAARCTGPIVRSAPRLSVTTRPVDGAAPSVPDPAVPTELSVLVDAVHEAADRLAIEPPHRPWLAPLPADLDPAEVDLVADPGGGGDPHDAVGLVDDPDRQSRRPLGWDPTDGNLALVGSLGSGTTSTLVALVASWCRTRPPDRFHAYVVDAAGDRSLDGLESIAHVGAVLRAREHERLHRLLARLAGELDARLGGAEAGTVIVLVVDGFDSLRAGLSSIDQADTLALLDRLATDGPAVGIITVAAGPDLGRLPSADRWVFVEPGPDGTGRVPGRVRVESTGLEAQVARGAPGLAALPDRSDGRGPSPIDALPDHIERRSLGTSWATDPGPRRSDHLVVGRCADGLADAALTVPAGDHVFVGGPARSGKTTALGVLVRAWCDLHPDGGVVEVDRRRALDLDALDGPTVVVVDDADRVDDPALVSLVSDRRPSVTLMAAARMEAVRSMYGHWTRDVARSRCGLVLTSTGDVDGDLLGASLPRRTLVPPRPGLAWLIDPGGQRLVQLATPT